jgi:hypothetical protein
MNQLWLLNTLVKVFFVGGGGSQRFRLGPIHHPITSTWSRVSVGKLLFQTPGARSFQKPLGKYHKSEFYKKYPAIQEFGIHFNRMANIFYLTCL